MPAQLMPVKLHRVGVPVVVLLAVIVTPLFEGAANGMNAAIEPFEICAFETA